MSNKRLVDFAALHPTAAGALQFWRRAVETAELGSFADLRRSFGAVDKVGTFFVFDIGDNKFRLIAAVHFNRQMLYIRHVFTHREYERWRP